MTLTGHLVSDTGREVGDDNVVVSTTVLFADTLVHTDVNGNFSLDFVALDTGTFTITVTYNDGNTTYTDNVTLVVNLPSTPPVEPPEAPVVGGGGGGGGGSGRPEENIQLKVSPETVLVGEEVSIEALCKWAFGCRLYINGNIVSQMTNSAGFQDFSRAFSEAGTYTIELYKKGTTDTLISRKTVTVNAPQNTGENENSGNDGTTPDEVYIPTYADTGTGDNSTGETPTEDGTEGNAPTGFFGLGPNFELGNMNFLNIFLLIIGMIALGIGLNEVVLIKKG